MEIKYYSELLDKDYDSEEDLLKDIDENISSTRKKLNTLIKKYNKTFDNLCIECNNKYKEKLKSKEDLLKELEDIDKNISSTRKKLNTLIKEYKSVEKSQFYFNIATGILDKDQTIRSLAKTFDMSKSTLHKILHSEDFINFIGFYYYKKLCDKLKLNFYNKHINGGKATSLRWKTIKTKCK